MFGTLGIVCLARVLCNFSVVLEGGIFVLWTRRLRGCFRVIFGKSWFLSF